MKRHQRKSNAPAAECNGATTGNKREDCSKRLMLCASHRPPASKARVGNRKSQDIVFSGGKNPVQLADYGYALLYTRLLEGEVGETW